MAHSSLSANSARSFYLPTMTVLLMIVQCGLGQSQSKPGATFIWPVYANSSEFSKAIPTTTTEEVRNQRGSCSTGTFYTSPYFPGLMNTALGYQIQEDYRMIYCTSVDLFNVADVLTLHPGNPSAFCQCDCDHAHGASKFDLDCGRDDPCICTYTVEDETKFQNSKRTEDIPMSAEVQLQPSLEHSEPDPKDMDSGAEGHNKSEVESTTLCKLVIGEIAIRLVCDDILLPNGDTFYTLPDNVTHLLPDDICAFDCWAVHGVRKEPYGSCCIANDGKKYCKCEKK